MTERASGYHRQKWDQYMTPPWALELLLEHERFGSNICDPACGTGNLLGVLQLHCPWAKVWGTDIDPLYGPGGQTWDFLDASWGFLVPDGPFDIIMNPPYGVQGRTAVQFIETALEMTSIYRGKVAVLVPIAFDAASTRTHILRDHPACKARYVHLDRLEWTNIPPSPDGHGSTKDHMWLVWDWMHEGPSTNHYLQLPAGRKKALLAERAERVKELQAETTTGVSA